MSPTHPGGLELTIRLGERLALAPGQRVLDVASGPGASALLLARDFGAQVAGVDLGAAAVAKASAASAEAGLADSVGFWVADAERLPFADAAFDAVICECALCTFPDKDAAAGKLARVLRPGGRVGITDVTVDSRAPDGELSTLAGWVGCIADAKTVPEYGALLARQGLRTITMERHDDAIAQMVDRIEERLLALQAVAGALPGLAGVGWEQALRMTRLAENAVADGVIGYALLVLERPT